MQHYAVKVVADVQLETHVVLSGFLHPTVIVGDHAYDLCTVYPYEDILSLVDKISCYVYDSLNNNEFLLTTSMSD